ncbi:Polyadenylate-binding protein-interacting protein 7 [Linum perenne]
MKPSRTRVKSPGWAAFDLKQRENAGGQLEAGKDPFPPVSNVGSSMNSRGNSVVAKKKLFSSVLLPAAEFPTLKFKRNDLLDDSLEKLKELHSWADSSLIEDILAAAYGDVAKASSLLKEMCSSGTNNSNVNKKRVLSGNTTDLAAEIADLSSTIENALRGTHEPVQFNDATTNMKLVLQHLRAIPVEPEWEEKDIYLSHRKDAIKMMRSASQHSRAATNAFLRNDHVSAREHSVKAQEDWMAAEKLNGRAAKEILSIRNSDNNLWKLDLHGLHAAEAVQALKEHLYKIETLLSVNRAPSPSVGNHSRGEAALPSAVRSFLNENGYRSDEARAGVISVWPKFRVR